MKKLVCFLLVVLTVLSCTTVCFAQNESDPALLIIVGKPASESIPFYEEDQLVVSIKDINSDKKYVFTLYGYNNYSDKYGVPAGEYAVTGLYIKDRIDVVLVNEGIVFTTEPGETTSLIIPLTNTADVIPDKETTTTGSSQLSSNPFESQTNSENSTTDKIPEQSGDSTTESQTSDSTTFNENEPSSTNVDATSQDETETESPEEEKNKSNLASKGLFIFIVLSILAVVAFIIFVKKRNED